MAGQAVFGEVRSACLGLPARQARCQAAADWPDYRTSGLRCKRGAMLMKFKRWYVVPTLVFFGSMERFLNEETAIIAIM